MTAWNGRLSGLVLSWKLLLTCFLVVLGAGYLNGVITAAKEVGLTPAAIAEHYGTSGGMDHDMADMPKAVEEQAIDLDAPAAPVVNQDKEPDRLKGLSKLAHFHLLGFALMLLSVGALICMTTLPERVKSALVVMLALCLFLDIAALFLVQFVANGFAWLNMATGVGTGVCIALGSARVLWELWGPARSA